MPSAKDWAICWLFLLGAVLGTGLDAFHVHSKVEHYAVPELFGLAWWVPLLFGVAAVGLGYFHPMVDPLFGQRRVPRPPMLCIVELVRGLLCYVCSATR